MDETLASDTREGGASSAGIDSDAREQNLDVRIALLGCCFVHFFTPLAPLPHASVPWDLFAGSIAQHLIVSTIGRHRRPRS